MSSMPLATTAADSASPGALPWQDRQAWQHRIMDTRARSLALASGLSAEDQGLQSMPDASPIKWHLAHTSWFFEAVVLLPLGHCAAFDTRYLVLFNSYYEALGPRHPRPQRGLLSRPSLDEVRAYRLHVDEALQRFIAEADEATWQSAAPLIELGLHHEQQHQELMVTDIQHAFSINPLLPAARLPIPGLTAVPRPQRWLRLPGGMIDIGAYADSFSFDNERPRHAALVPAFEIMEGLVSCEDYLRFIDDGGYRRPEFWLSDGWALVQSQGWQQPLYWLPPGDPRVSAPGWHVFGLEGAKPLDLQAPVSQLSFFEAAAYAEWAGARLPTDFEWEAAAASGQCGQMQGQVWQWTRSAYHPYPGFRPLKGAVGEYNGKFMVGQLVLRGSSVATPPGHARASYRNFFPPAARWQFSGLRLARDLPAGPSPSAEVH